MVKLDAIGSDMHGSDHALSHTFVKQKHSTTIYFHSENWLQPTESNL